MKRKLIASVVALALALPLGVTSVLASENDTSSIAPLSAQAPFSFALQKGAASSSSAVAYKNDYTSAEVYSGSIVKTKFMG
ncbi:hypothetical protein [Desulfitobacterium hafniense]|uniref:Uncharacterized protein n=1 Tax=Desulfitobacterium hafniense (strain Y51) TaxID=138119 RepID=Q24VK1_DESHY|nr:hypothetical protein [Desulfitobacterium hafniense]BAE83941.1 hypothetical protein DSY2152 [Desulfitobacterium hafniense Y51]